MAGMTVDVIRRLQVVMETKGLKEGQDLLQAVADAGGDAEAALRKIGESSTKINEAGSKVAQSVERQFRGVYRGAVEGAAAAEKLSRQLGIVRDFTTQHGGDPVALRMAAQALDSLLAKTNAYQTSLVEVATRERQAAEVRRGVAAGLRTQADGELQLAQARKQASDVLARYTALQQKEREQQAARQQKQFDDALLSPRSIMRASEGVRKINESAAEEARKLEKLYDDAILSPKQILRAQSGVRQLVAEAEDSARKVQAQFDNALFSPKQIIRAQSGVRQLVAEAEENARKIQAQFDNALFSPKQIIRAQSGVRQLVAEAEDNARKIQAQFDNALFSPRQILRAQSGVRQLVAEAEDDARKIQAQFEDALFSPRQIMRAQSGVRQLVAEVEDEARKIQAQFDNALFSPKQIMRAQQGVRQINESVEAETRKRQQQEQSQFEAALLTPRQIIRAQAGTRSFVEGQDADASAADVSIERQLNALLKEHLEIADSEVQELHRLEAAQDSYDEALRRGLIDYRQWVALNEHANSKLSILRRNLGQDGLSSSLKFASHEWVNFGQQMNDVVTMLASGSSPFQILATQGGQFYQLFANKGGLGAFFKATKEGMVALVTSTAGLATMIGGTLVGAVASAVAMWNSYDASVKSVERSLMGVGRGTGVLAEQLVNQGNAAADSGGISRKDSRAVMGALAGTGRIDPEVFDAATKSAKDFAALTGQEIPEAMNSLAGNLASGERGVDALNEQFNLFNVAEVKALKQMIATGDRAGAQKILITAVADTVKGAADKTSYWSRTWADLGKTFSNTADRIGEWLDGPALGQKIEDRAKQIEAFNKRMRASQEDTTTPGGAVTGIIAPRDQARLRAQQQDLIEQQRRDEQLRAQQTEDARRKKREADAADLSRRMAALYEGSDPLNEGIERTQKNLEAARASVGNSLTSWLPKDMVERWRQFADQQERSLALQREVKSFGSEAAMQVSKDASFEQQTARADEYSKALAEIGRQFEQNMRAAESAGNDADRLTQQEKYAQALRDQVDALRQRTQLQSEFEAQDATRSLNNLDLDEYTRALDEIDAKWKRINETRGGDAPTRANRDITRQAEKDGVTRQRDIDAQRSLEAALATQRRVYLDDYSRQLEEIDEKWDEIDRTKGGGPEERRARDAERQVVKDTAGLTIRKASEDAAADAAFQRRIATAGEYESTVEGIRHNWEQINRLQGGDPETLANRAAAMADEIAAATDRMVKEAREATRALSLENAIADLNAYEQGLQRINAELRLARENAKGNPVLEGEADRQAGERRQTLTRETATGTIRSWAPEGLEALDIQKAAEGFAQALDQLPLDEIERLKGLGVDLALIFDRMATAFANVRTPVQQMAKDLELNVQAIKAVTMEEQAAVEGARAYDAAIKSRLSEEEALVAKQNAITEAYERVGRAARDLVRDSGDERARIGMRPFQAGALANEQQRVRDIERLGVQNAGAAGAAAETRRLSQGWEMIGQPMRDANDDIQAQAEMLRVAQETWGKTAFEIEKAAAAQRLMNEYMRAGVEITPELRAEIERYADRVGAVAEATESFERQKQTVEDLHNTGRDAFKGLFSDIRQGKSLVDSLTNAFDKLLDKILDMMIDSFFDPKANNIWSMLMNPSELFKAFMPKTYSGATGGTASMAAGAAGYYGTNFSQGAQPQGVGGTTIAGSLVPPMVMPTAAKVAEETGKIVKASLDPIGDVIGAGSITRGGSPLTTVSANNLFAQVNAQYADRFQNLLKGFEANGYQIDKLGGYNYRNIAGTNKLSEHADGRAIDINGFNGPGIHANYGRDASGKLLTDMDPDLARRLAAENGLKWGGDFKHNPDPMHFEVDPNWKGRQAFNGNASNDNLIGGAGADKLSGDFDKLSQSTQNLTPNMDQLGQGVTQVGQNLSNQAPQIGQNLNQLADTTGRGGDAVGGALQSTASTIGQGASGIGNGLQQLMQALQQGGSGGGFGGLMNLFGSGGGSNPFTNGSGLDWGQYTNGVSFLGMHDGGEVGRDVTFTRKMSFFNGLPKYHQGHRPDEVPTLLQQGEWVLSRDDVQNIKQGANSNQSGGYSGPRVIVNNNGPTDAHAQEHEDGSIEVMVDAMDSKLGDRMARRRGATAKAVIGTAQGKHLRG